MLGPWTAWNGGSSVPKRLCFRHTASHAAGAQQPFTFTGNWGAGPHSVSVKYLNDAYGGISATDRNLFLMSATYDGQAYANVDKGMYSAGETA